MNENLDNLLCEKYPKIFADRNKSMNQTCMCWGFEHGDGWFNIIDQLCGHIQWHIDQRTEHNERCRKIPQIDRIKKAALGALHVVLHTRLLKPITKRIPYRYLPLPNFCALQPDIPQVVVDQVKEKFGTLRFYYHGGDEYIRGLVGMAEAMSARTCEECGAPGTTEGPGWIRTLCKKHRRE
jgi:hypothetical protein